MIEIKVPGLTEVTTTDPDWDRKVTIGLGIVKRILANPKDDAVSLTGDDGEYIGSIDEWGFDWDGSGQNWITVELM